MIVHSYVPRDFEPSDLQPIRKDAYLEASHYEVLVVEPQRQIKLRSRHIAAAAARLFAEQTKEKNPISESEIVKVIEMLASSLTTGVHVCSPFSRESLIWLNGLMGTSPLKINQWCQIIKYTIPATESEVVYRHYLLYAHQARILLKLLKRMAPALQLGDAFDEMADQIADNFLRFCANQESIPSEEKSYLQPLISNFLRNFAQILRLGSEAEVVLNSCRFFGEQLTSRYTCSLQEWEFLINSIEQQIIQKVGLFNARPLAHYFSILSQAIPRFTFAGEYYRQQDNILKNLAKTDLPRNFNAKLCLNLVFGEMLFTPALSYRLMPSRSLILKGESFLQTIPVEVYKTFIHHALHACRPLGERSSLDWLENKLRRTQKNLEFWHERKEVELLFQKTLEITATNLRQGLNVFNTHPALVADLSLVLDEVQHCILLAENIGQAKQLFRAWFILTFATEESTEIWQHGRVITSALLTSIRQNTAFEAYWKRYGAALELLEDIPKILEETKFVLSGWPHLTAITEQVAALHGKLDKRIPWMLQAAFSDYLLEGTPYSTPKTLSDLIEINFLDLMELSLPDTLEIHRLILAALNQTEPFATSSFTTSYAQLEANLLSTLLSVKLWMDSQEIGAEVSAEVFQRIPDYHEKTGGAAGIAKCTRDNAITLRRVALALEPTVLDRIEFVQGWWNNLINYYIVTRPDNLLIINKEQIVLSCQKHLGGLAANLINTLIEPCFGTSLSQQDSFKATAALRPIGKKMLLQEAMRDASDLDIAVFFSSALVESFKHATGIAKSLPTPHFTTQTVNTSALKTDPTTFLEQNLDYVGGLLIRDFTAFEWNGFIDMPAILAWRGLISAADKNAGLFQRFITGLIYQTDLLPHPTYRLRVIDFLQAHLEFVRQCTAAFELTSMTAQLAQKIALELETNYKAELNLQSKIPNREKIQRDIAFILDTLTQSLTSNSKILALLEVYRIIGWSIASELNYGKKIWSILWKSIDKETQVIFTLNSFRELKNWWIHLGNMGPSMLFVGLIHQNFVNAKEPIFSLDPDEELNWRNILNALLTTLLFERTAAPWAEKVRIQITINNSLTTNSSDFENRLDQLMKLLKNWFIDIDLKVIQSEIDSLKATVKNIRILEEFMTNLPQVIPRIVDRLPSLATVAHSLDLFLIRLARHSLQMSECGTSRWNISSLLQGLSIELITALRQLSESERERFRVVLINTFSLSGGSERIAEAWLKLDQLLKEEETFFQIWQKLAQQSEISKQDPSHKKLLLWLSRRLLSSAWNMQNQDDTLLMEWYLYEIATEVNPSQQEDWKKKMEQVPNYFDAHKQLSERARKRTLLLIQSSANFAT